MQDFENDSELTQCLKEALENLISRSYCGNLEYHQAQQLCRYFCFTIKQFFFNNFEISLQYSDQEKRDVYYSTSQLFLPHFVGLATGH